MCTGCQQSISIVGSCVTWPVRAGQMPLCQQWQPHGSCTTCSLRKFTPECVKRSSQEVLVEGTPVFLGWLFFMKVLHLYPWSEHISATVCPSLLWCWRHAELSTAAQLTEFSTCLQGCGALSSLLLSWCSDATEVVNLCVHQPTFIFTSSFLFELPCNQFPPFSLHFRSDDEDVESRSSRVTQLCTYFQQKYKHLCRLERAESRQKKCRHTFRKALLQAASKEPECTGQLIQELRRAACSRARLEPRFPGSQASQTLSPSVFFYISFDELFRLCEANI